MFERFMTKVKPGTAGPTSKFLSWLQVVPPGIWIVALAVTFVGGRWIWIEAGRPAHRQEIVAALGSINKIYEGAQMNHDGSRFIYVGEGKRGSVVYLCDTATGHKQVVCEGKGKGQWQNEFNLHVWSWSPDDSSFIYVNDDELVVCPADTNQPSVSLPIAGTNGISDVVWLNPDEFAFVANHNILGQGIRQPDGRWELRQFPYSHEFGNLAAVGDHEVAWLQDSRICRVELAGDSTSNPFKELKSTAPPPAKPFANNLVLWLDASILKQADQTIVESLEDLSSSRNSAIVNGHPPVFNAPGSAGSLNGMGTIHFATFGSLSNSTGLKTEKTLGITGAAPRSIFAVMRRDPGKSMRISTGNSGRRGQYCGLCDQNYGLWLPSGGITDDNAFPALKAAWNILSVVCDGSGEKGFVNGVLKGSASFPMNTADAAVELGLRIAQSGDTNRSAGSDGDFAELLIYNRALNPVEQRQIEDYLSAKWLGTRLLSTDNSYVWLDPQISGILSFDYSKETGQFLLVNSENGRNALWRFDPTADKSERMVQIPQVGSIRGVQWAGKNAFAYTSPNPIHQGLLLADVSGVRKDWLLKGGKVDWHGVSQDGTKLLVVVTITNELSAGIWAYDLASRKLQTVVPYSDHPSDLIKPLVSASEKITLPSGRSVDCTIFPPANFDRHKKYPLIIVDSAWTYSRPWISTLENCGAFVAITKRDGWFDGIEQMGENILGAYKHLIQNPSVDARQVYAMGASAETRYFNKMVTATPGLWKGVIINSPIELPDFSGAPPFQTRPRILLTAGGREHNEDRLKKYQQEALSHGIVVDYIIYPEDGHVAVGNGSLLDRNRDLVHFIFEE